jgi:hypothetical protein
MEFKKEDNTLGVVVTSLVEKKEGICLADEEFALYMEGRLDNQRRKAIISHFVSCRECRERLTLPIFSFEHLRESNAIEKLKAFFRSPLFVVPVMALFFALIAIALNVYLKSLNIPEERYRGGNLVALKQVDLTPNLLTIIKEGDEEELKNELVKELPPGSRVSRIEVEDHLMSLREVKGKERIILILYSNGLLKVKMEK